MGSRGRFADEEPIHRVVISEDFWLGTTPVTQSQFGVWTKAAGIKHSNHFSGRPDHPAETLSWDEAKGFCEWLTLKFADQLSPDHRIARLPCESQWEYACRAGTKTEYSTGDGEAALRLAGWYGEERNQGSTHAVGELAENEFGLRDMHGNVWEWCRDRWDSDAYRRRWEGITERETYALSERFGRQGDDANRVLRGGSWSDAANGCRSAYRLMDWAGVRIRFFGFRVCLVRSP